MGFFGGFIGRQVLKRVSGGRVQQPGKVQAVLRLPTLLRLGYALIRDGRVPLWMRGTVLGLLVLIFSPVDLAGNIPVVGQFWDFTLAVVVLDGFIALAPAQVVNEHIKDLGLESKIKLREM